MADKITPRSKDFPQWYQDVVLQSRLADYSPVKGCMVIRPNGYSIWERIQADLDRRIKESGARNAYFPLFIPESFLKKEAEHVEGFAPEVAVVTHAGAKDLEEKLVVRPTSETIINSMFSKWIQSYRDLPLLLNQWANVVRWEMRTRLFLRTTEFLWQEGHTCHATPEGAEDNTRQMLGVYRDFCEEILAMPVLWGLKSDNERFAGALRTYCVEAMMQDKKALQAGTSHNLSTNFAKAFQTQYLGQDGKLQWVHQTSWGVSTRLIGGMVMTHSDDKGLVIPPAVAHTHVVIVPIFAKDPAQRQKLYEVADQIQKDIQAESSKLNLRYSIRVEVDRDETKKPGWKFNEYELTGIPIRVELGPRDLEKGQVVVARRDLDQKQTISLDQAASFVTQQLVQMQTDLLERAREFRKANTSQVSTYDEFKKQIEEKGGFFEVSWSMDSEAEKKIKEETKATIRCILLDQSYQPIQESAPCFYSGKNDGKNVRVVFARAY